MRTLVLNCPELRRGLEKVYRSITLGLTQDEWRAIQGAQRLLERAARRQRLQWLREALADSGLPVPLRWFVERQLKKREFTLEELEAEIKAARERSADGQGKAEQLAS